MCICSNYVFFSHKLAHPNLKKCHLKEIFLMPSSPPLPQGFKQVSSCHDHKPNRQLLSMWDTQRSPWHCISTWASLLQTPKMLQNGNWIYSPGDFWWKNLSWKSKCFSNRLCGWQLLQKLDLGWPHRFPCLNTWLEKRDDDRWADGQGDWEL